MNEVTKQNVTQQSHTESNGESASKNGASADTSANGAPAAANEPLPENPTARHAREVRAAAERTELERAARLEALQQKNQQICAMAKDKMLAGFQGFADNGVKNVTVQTIEKEFGVLKNVPQTEMVVTLVDGSVMSPEQLMTTTRTALQQLGVLTKDDNEIWELQERGFRVMRRPDLQNNLATMDSSKFTAMANAVHVNIRQQKSTTAENTTGKTDVAKKWAYEEMLESSIAKLDASNKKRFDIAEERHGVKGPEIAAKRRILDGLKTVPDLVEQNVGIRLHPNKMPQQEGADIKFAISLNLESKLTLRKLVLAIKQALITAGMSKGDEIKTHGSPFIGEIDIIFPANVVAKIANMDAVAFGQALSAALGSVHALEEKNKKSSGTSGIPSVSP